MDQQENYKLFGLMVLISVSCSVAQNNSNGRLKSLMRDQVNKIGYANFVKHENSSLNVSVALNGFVRLVGECAYVCINSSNGFSFNFAANADIHGRHICEILSTDKYNDSANFISKTGFRHYSIFVGYSVISYFNSLLLAFLPSLFPFNSLTLMIFSFLFFLLIHRPSFRPFSGAPFSCRSYFSSYCSAKLFLYVLSVQFSYCFLLVCYLT